MFGQQIRHTITPLTDRLGYWETPAFQGDSVLHAARRASISTSVKNAIGVRS